MRLDGLLTIGPDQPETIGRIADIIGLSFMEEQWTTTMLASLGGPEAYDRKLQVGREMVRQNLMQGAACECCYATPDFAGVAGAYLKSELDAAGRRWSDFEDAGMSIIAREMLSAEEAAALTARFAEMGPISDFSWEYAEAQARGYDDFIHLTEVAVDPAHRGTGAFRRLAEPFFSYADEHGIPCFLETYSASLEALYQHVGFETVRILTAPGFDIAEYCMARWPRSATATTA